MKRLSATLIGSASSAFIAAVVIAYPAWTQTARPSPDTVEAHIAAGKNAAGGRDDTPDFYGLVTAICVAPLNGAARPDAPAPRENPNRKETYMEPIQAFDDLYWMGTPSTSSWLLTSDDGYILYDTQRVYDAEDVLVAGIKKLGFDPAKVKYVIISHGHAGEVGGAFLFQSRYGSRIVMNDWDMVRGIGQRVSDRQAKARYRPHGRDENHSGQQKRHNLSDAWPHPRNGLEHFPGA